MRLKADLAVTLIAVCVPLNALAQDSHARAELTLNYVFNHNYSRTFEHSNEHARETENLSFHGTFRRQYDVEISHGAIMDLRELGPDEIKKLAVPGPSVSGALQYRAHGTSVIGSSKQTTMSQQYSGKFDKDAAALVVMMDNGIGLHLAIHPKTLSGSCTYETLTTTSLCRAVPFPNRGPTITADAKNTGSMDWAVDIRAAPPPNATLYRPPPNDPFNGYDYDSPVYGLRVAGNNATGYALSFHHNWQFHINNASDGDRVARKSLEVEGTLLFKELKCSLTEAMVRAAFANLVPTLPPDVQSKLFQTGQAAPNDVVFRMTEAPSSTEPGFVIAGTAVLMNDHQYRVTASLLPTGAKQPTAIEDETADGCMVGGNDAPGLDAAFSEAIVPLVARSY